MVTDEMPTLCRMQVPTERGPLEYFVAGSGPPILYFHGTGAESQAVMLMEPDLLEDGFRLIVPARPGYDGTPLCCGGTPQDAADLAGELLIALEIRRVAVIGTSGGGLAAAAFASRHAERVVALVLQCALAHPYDRPRWLPSHLAWLFLLFRFPRRSLPLLRFGYRLEMRRLRRDPQRLLKSMAGERYDELAHEDGPLRLARRLTESTLRCAEQPAGVENDWYNAAERPWLERAAIRCPTLILHDRADPLVPFAHAEWAKAQIPQAELVELHAGGHLIWFGRDGQRMRKVRAAFLRRAWATSSIADAAIGGSDSLRAD